MSIDIRNTTSIVERFKEAVRKHGSLPAVEFDGRTWLYDELDCRSDDLAYQIHDRCNRLGSGSRSIVVIDCERGQLLVLAVLACVKARVAFFVIGENQPEMYVARAIEGINSIFWLGAEGYSNAEKARRIARDQLRTCYLFNSNKLRNSDKAKEIQLTQCINGVEDIESEGMYLVATSGTTGRPKLVFTGASPIANFIDWYQREFSLSCADKFSMLSGLGYDPLIRDIFTPLCIGACVSIPAKEVLSSLHGLREWISSEQVSVIHATPQVAEIIFDPNERRGEKALFDSLRVVAIGGAVLTKKLAANIKAQLPYGSLVNVYGTSETPQVMTYHIVEALTDEALSSIVPIGKPIHQVSVQIVDDDGVALGQHAVGEIHIATPHLSMGYYQDSELTDKRFTFSHKHQCQSYRTGDLGFIDADGNLNFVGRKDRQVKHRGYRIQLEEIEQAVLKLEGVLAAAVVHEGVKGAEKIFCYVQYKFPVQHKLADIKQKLLNVLPTYMMPDRYIVLEQMPLNSSNKINYGALAQVTPATDVARKPDVIASAKGNQVTNQLLSIWSSVLGVATADIALDSNFFDMGGTSLLSARVIDHINKSFSKRLTITDLFVYSNIADLSEYIARRDDAPPFASQPARASKRADCLSRNSIAKKQKAAKVNMSDLTNAIAIVGMSLRFPKATTPDEFWKNLVEGRDCAKLLDKEQLLKLGVAREKLESPEYVYRSYDLDDIDLFDARFFGISPREAKMADPQLRIMLEAAQECIEDSGHILQGTNTGMYVGVADHKYWMYYTLFQSALEEQNEVAKRIFNIKDFFATQLSHKLGLNGPSISLSSACSTGLVATHEACNHLLMHDCDYAIAGGCEILQGVGYQYLEGGLSARDGYVKAFDKDASGTVFGSGVGMVLLRRLSDAIEDCDKIYAVIRSTAVNNDGNQKIGYMAPGVKGQMTVIHEAIERAGISARDISYVEAHGTGTKVGDPIEIESISKVYRKYTDDTQYCAIGSVKTNVGHLSIAAGIAGLIKTALMLHHKKIPPILHYNESNPAIDFASSPFYVSRELRDWSTDDGKRIAGISAFGVGGTNAHAIVEETPLIAREVEAKPYHKLFVITAKSEKALLDSKERLAVFLRNHPDASLADVAFSLNVGRQKFDYRSFLVADSCKQLAEVCDKPTQGVYHIPTNSNRQTVFMFPGQGSQYANMALQLYQEEPVFKRYVDRCCEEAKTSLGVDVLSVLFPASAGDADRINQTEYTQISLFVISYSLAQLWMRWGVNPDAMIGHSIGEYVAACLAGVFSVNDALKLVAHRGRLMQSMPKGSMLSVPRPKQEVACFLDDALSIAAENSPASCVVSGSDDAIERLKAKLLLADIKSTLLHTSHAFHSRMMDPILKAYEKIVCEVELGEVHIPFISNVTGSWITSEQATDPSYWVAQLREAVLFSKGVQTIAVQESVFLEMGPGATLCSLVGQHDFPHECLSINTLPRLKEDISAANFILTALGKACCYGIDVDWQTVYGKSGGKRISLPTYPFERKSYWLDEETLVKPKAAVVAHTSLEHPLLGRKVVASAKVVVFENIIDKETPKFIADHRLIETVIFPGAGFTQMGLEVGKHFIKNKKIKVDEIRFAQAMMLNDGVRKVVQVVATANGEGCTFEILSRNLDKSEASDSSAWVLHAKGKISPHSVSAPTMSMPLLASDAARELLPLSRYYDALKFITFGPSFRAIKRLWIGETAQGELESLGLVELPQHLYPEVDRYSFHPVLLDAAFQVIDGPKISQTGTLPVGLRNFIVYDAVPNAFYVHAIRREHAEEEEYSIGEITIFSEQGAIIAKIDHYLQKEIADSVATDDQLADVLFDINWEKVDQQIVKSTAPRKTWIVIGENSSLEAGLKASLQQQDKFVLVLPHGLIDEGNVINGVGGKAVAAQEHDLSLSREALKRIARSEVDTIVLVKSVLAQNVGAPTNDKPASNRPDALALSLEVLTLAKLINRCDAEIPPRVVIVTSGAQLIDKEIHVDEYDVHQAALWGMGNTLTVEHPEYRCLRADLDETEASLHALIADIVQGDTLENQLAYRAGQRFTPRLAKYAGSDASKNKLQLPSGPFEVRLMRFGTFDNFAVREFVPDLLGDNEVLVEMHSVALNFKETLYVLGFLNPNNRQAANFDFGMEGAGRIKRVGAKVSHLQKGDDVIIWHNGCLSSDFVVNVDRVIRKPKSLSYAEAACIPTVFLTAYYALYHLAKITAGDKILIHAAAGGVGQVAIQIAKAVGAEVYATASRGKWQHLRDQGVEHIFDSRTLEFSAQILEITAGEGVDIVFNSLTGDFIGKSFDALGKKGRFVEIGKKDIWSNEQAAAYRADVNYKFFEIGEDQVSGGIGGTTIINELMVQILNDFARGALTALHMTEFSVSEVHQAYRYLSAGKNIGKVVVNVDEHRSGKVTASFVTPEKTYLVTGGSGGLGFLCAEWLIGQGAKNIALTARREPRAEVAEKIRDLNKIGINVYFVRGDIGDQKDAASIIQTIQSGDAPLGGILHCAGVLEDALIEQQTSETFATVFKPKVMGTLHLHESTKNLPLDFFICFSSVSAIIDGGGQSNYAAANAFMDRLMSFRRSQSLAGLSVNWGAWADVGMAAQLAEKRAMDMSHFISKSEAFMSLERLICNQNVQGVVCRLGNRLGVDTKSRMLLNLVQQRDEAGKADSGDLQLIFLQNPHNSVQRNMELFLKAQVNKVLGVDAAEEINGETEFVALGVDSLSMTELKNAVQHGMGCYGINKPLKMAVFFANPTVARLAQHLATEYADQFASSPSADADSASTTLESEPAATKKSVANHLPEAGHSIEFATLENKGNGKTLFCFPGLNGNIFDFSDLVTESKQRFKVVVGEINSDIATLETDIRRIAADAIHHMKRLQHSGPYALLGYSYGGVVALEIAHQLAQANEDIAVLMMIDSFPHFYHRHDYRFMNFMSALITDSILAPMKLDQDTYDRLALQIMHTPGDQLEEVLQRSDGGSDHTRVNLNLLNSIVEAGKKRAVAFYEPPKNVEGLTIRYVRAGSYPRSMSLAKLDGFLEESSMRDEKYWWSKFVANSFAVHRVEAQHNEILKAKNARTIMNLVEDAMTTTSTALSSV